MKKLQGFAAGVFVLAVVVLGFISVLGIWKIFDNDVVWKSFQTIGLLAVVALVVIAAGKFLDKNPDVIYAPNPVWGSIRRATVGALIVAVVILALLGVLSIWDIVDKEVLYKCLGTLAVLAFDALIIIFTCKAMEGPETPVSKQTIAPQQPPQPLA